MAISKGFVCWGLVFLVLVLVVLLFSAPDYQPYYKNIPYAKYEGFDVYSQLDGFVEGASKSESDKGNTSASGSSVSESSVASSLSSLLGGKKDGFVTLHPANVSGQGGVESTGVNSIFTNQPVNRVVYGADVKSSEHLDYFMDVKNTGIDGQNGCQSSGLSNSLGQLCLSADLVQQLRTRGGNATGQ